VLRSRAARRQQLEQQRLSAESPDTALNHALHRAVWQLDACLADVPGLGRCLAEPDSQNPDDPVVFRTRTSVQLALAALAVGDVAAARAVIEFLGSTQDPRGQVPSIFSTSGRAEYSSPDDTLLYLLLLARYFAWSADIPLLHAHWGRVQPALAACRGSHHGLATVLRELAVTAEAIGAEKPIPIQPARRNDAQAGWEFLAAWTSVSESSATSKRNALPNTAAPIASFVHGLLGVEPDAIRGRLRLRPMIPADWDVLTVRRLRLGESLVELHYQRSQTDISFELNQLAGTVPLRVIFEPIIAADTISSVTVDDRPASLDLQRRGELWFCPVQVVLDHARSVHFAISP
jgi:hypothetical protein